MTGDLQVPDGGGVEALRAEVRSATEDYRRLFPEPYSLSPNLSLAVRAVAALDDATMRADGMAANEAYAVKLANRLLVEQDKARAALASQPARLDVAVAAAGPWSCCEHCAEDDVHDVDRNGHDIPCQTCVYAEVIRRASQPAPTVTDEACMCDGSQVDPHTEGEHYRPAQSGDGVAEKAWDEGHRRGYSDGYDDNGNGYTHDPDVEYTPDGNPYRTARIAKTEADR